MAWNSAVMTDDDFSRMTFFDKASLALELTKSYGLNILALLLVIALMVGLVAGVFTALVVASVSGAGSGSLGAGSVVLLILVGLVFFVLMLLVWPMLGISLKLLVLHYVNGDEMPGGVFGAVSAPWSRLGFFVLCLLLWLAVNVAVQMVSSVLGLIPILGFLVLLAIYIFYYMVYNCAITFMADRGLYRADVSDPTRAIVDPFKMIKNNIGLWIGAYLAMMVLYLPAVILSGLGFYFMEISDNFGLGLICVLLAVASLLPASIYDLFFMTITYKQTAIIEENISGIFE